MATLDEIIAHFGKDKGKYIAEELPISHAEIVDNEEGISYSYDCNNYGDCDNCEDYVKCCDDNCEIEEEDRDCSNCGNYEDEHDCRNCDLTCTSQNQGYDEDCMFYQDYLCESGRVNIELKNLNIENKMITNGSNLCYFCAMCDELVQVQISCTDTYSVLKTAVDSEIPLKLTCSNCVNSHRICQRTHEKKINLCWTEAELAKMKEEQK